DPSRVSDHATTRSRLPAPNATAGSAAPEGDAEIRNAVVSGRPVASRRRPDTCQEPERSSRQTTAIASAPKDAAGVTSLPGPPATTTARSDAEALNPISPLPPRTAPAERFRETRRSWAGLEAVTYARRSCPGIAATAAEWPGPTDTDLPHILPSSELARTYTC